MASLRSSQIFKLLRTTLTLRDCYTNNSTKRFVSRKTYKHPVYPSPGYRVPESHERTDVPIYPPVKPRYPPGMESRLLSEDDNWTLFNKLKSLKDLEKLKDRLETMGVEPVWALNLSPYDSWPNTLQYKQYLTKTHIVKGLPSVYDDVLIDSVYERIKPLIIQALSQQMVYYVDNKDYENEVNLPPVILPKEPIVRPKKFCDNVEVSAIQEHNRTHKLCGLLIQNIISALSTENEHLLRSQLDENVRVETFFKRAGFDGDDKALQGKWNGMTMVQHKHVASYQIRGEMPLPEFVPHQSDLCTKGEYPTSVCSPKAVGQTEEKLRPVTVSGHWTGDPCEFSRVGFHVLPPEVESTLRRNYGERYVNESSLLHGLVGSFGWCVAQAYNQGFSWYDDITYPFTTQTVVMNGPFVRLCAYQLNTVHLWREDSINPLRNILWTTEPARLYDSLDSDGTVRGLNDDLCRSLIKFFLLPPRENIIGAELRPNLPLEEAPVKRRKFIEIRGENEEEEPVPVQEVVDLKKRKVRDDRPPEYWETLLKNNEQKYPIYY